MKYPRYVGKNSLSAKLNSRHPSSESEPKYTEILTEIHDKIIGILKRTTPKKHCGIPSIVIFSLIPYTTNIHEVAFAVSKNLYSKFILIFLRKLVLKSILL